MSDNLPFPVPDASRFQRRITSADIAVWNPHWELPEGMCRWCGKTIDRSVREDRRRRKWHKRCKDQFDALFYSPRRVAFERDKGVCRECGRDCGALDDRLWKMRGCYTWQRWWVVVRRLWKWYGFPADIVNGVMNSTWDADHIIPVSQGGGMLGPSNIQTLCVWCHREKTNARRGPIVTVKEAAS